MIFEPADLRTLADRAAGWAARVRRGDEGAIDHAERLAGGRMRRGPRSSESSRLRLVRRRAAGARA